MITTITMEVTTGRFDSVTIKIRSNTLSYEEIQDTVKKYLIEPKGAVYLAIDEGCMDQYFCMTQGFGMKFHHYQDGTYVYYTWQVRDQTGKLIEDLVPAYASSVEGVGAFIVSPDSKRLLLVWEYGKWKLVTGSLKPGESLIETIHREIKEEVGLTINPKFVEPLGGWHIAKARFDLINDNFHVFYAQATDVNFKVDGVEIKDAQWFDMDALARIQRPTFKQLQEQNLDPTSFSVDAEINGVKTKVSWIMLEWLVNCYCGMRNQVWVTGKYTIFV